MIKIVFFDVDGTLLSHKSKCVPESARRAINKLKELGIKVCLATGRNLLELEEPPISDMEFDGYLVQNGQICYNDKKEMLYGFPLEQGSIDKLVELFNKKQTPILFVEGDHMYMNYVSDRVIQIQEDILSSVPPTGTYEGGLLYHICFYLDEEEVKPLAKMFPECKITRWHPKAVELISGDGGKRASVAKYIEVFGYKRDEVMAFGDGENDMEMLEYAGIGVAMGNANDMAKRAADYVTDDIDENGVENALKHFGII